MVHPECGMSVYLIVWFIQVQSQVISLQISHLQFDDIMCITATQTLFIQHSQLLWPWHFARFNCWKLPRIQISCEISSITDSADLQEYNWITFICITVLKKERVVQKPEKSEDKKFGDKGHRVAATQKHPSSAVYNRPARPDVHIHALSLSQSIDDEIPATIIEVHSSPYENTITKSIIDLLRLCMMYNHNFAQYTTFAFPKLPKSGQSESNKQCVVTVRVTWDNCIP